MYDPDKSVRQHILPWSTQIAAVGKLLQGFPFVTWQTHVRRDGVGNPAHSREEGAWRRAPAWHHNGSASFSDMFTVVMFVNLNTSVFCRRQHSV